MLALGSDCNRPPLVLLCRADAVNLERTVTTSSAGELDLDHCIFSVVDRRRPTDTRFSLRAGRLLAFPIDEKLTDIDPLLSIGLPLHICPNWAKDINPILLLTARQDGCSNVARIEQVLTRSKLCLPKVSMDCLCYDLICGSSGGG